MSIFGVSFPYLLQYLTISQKCTLDECRGPLTNYRNGRFCEDHINFKDICGIIPCGQPIGAAGALTCNNPSHKAYYQRWLSRFGRLSYQGVKRVIRRQRAAEGEPQAGHPELRPELPAIGNTPGHEVVQTFRAGSIYCIETVQWACGCPVGWGKCYKSESSPQVLAILDCVWEKTPESRPAFVTYDDACNLLRHIVIQDPQSPWLTSTRFIVDAWHYIGHRATDVLCRTWCNPAPANGTQPDLVIAQEDDSGEVHLTRAFNTETSEQLNAWLNGFEAQMRQMTDYNFDFFMHSILLIYKDAVEERIVQKGYGLPDEEETDDEVDGSEPSGPTSVDLD